MILSEKSATFRDHALDRELSAPPQLARLAIGQRGHGKIGSTGAVVVLMIGDLPRAGAARTCAGGELAELGNVVERDQAALDWAPQVALPFAGHRFAQVGNDDVGARRGAIVDLATRLREE